MQQDRVAIPAVISLTTFGCSGNQAMRASLGKMFNAGLIYREFPPFGNETAPFNTVAM